MATNLICRKVAPPLISSVRLLSFSCPKQVRDIVIKDDAKTITIEGVYKESDRKKSLVSPEALRSPACGAQEECHPLCRFAFVHEIKHTDVLILEQFVDSTGKVIPRGVTGLCQRQHYRMEKLTGMAQKAGLMGSKDRFLAEKSVKPWAKYNSYWDEKTIDVQWKELQKKKKKSSFKK